MKKLLILGGASVHCKLVQAAREMGIYTIVTDYLVDSPAKKMADKSYMFDVNDVESIVDMCRKEGVSGVLSTHLDPCQRPYQQICERLGLPCFGNAEQFFQLTDKHAFKQLCRENDVDVIREYTEQDIWNGTVDYPVFIKPVDSRGSRGQSVCYNREEAEKAVSFARSESSNGDILIETYMAGAHEVQVTYFFVDGEPYLIRTVDSHRGSERNGLEKVVVCAISPSRYTDAYMNSAHKNVVAMLKKMGIRNGPAFMQGFYDNGKFRFFDPGLRFPGVDYERIYQRAYGIDLVKETICFALNGWMDIDSLPIDSMKIQGKYAAVLFPVITAGTIASVDGVDELLQDSRVISWLPRHFPGETIGWTRDVNQRLAEIDVLCNDKTELMDMITWIWNTLRVTGDGGQQMLMPLIDMEH